MAELHGSVVFTPNTLATLASVTSSITAVTLFAEYPLARARSIYNDSTSTMFLKYGAGASSTSYTIQIAAGAYFEFPQPLYAGLVSAIWTTANGAARTSEW